MEPNLDMVLMKRCMSDTHVPPSSLPIIWLWYGFETYSRKNYNVKMDRQDKWDWNNFCNIFHEDLHVTIKKFSYAPKNNQLLHVAIKSVSSTFSLVRWWQWRRVFITWHLASHAARGSMKTTSRISLFSITKYKFTISNSICINSGIKRQYFLCPKPERSAWCN